MQPLANQRVTVFGLGRFGGGIAVTKWLVSQGAMVTVTDQDTPEKLATSVAQLAGLPITLHIGTTVLEDFTSADLLVASPAIPPHNELLAAARDAAVPITTEIRLFIERCPAEIFAVTGTKGKSTTSAMLGHMLRRRRPTFVGGNIGGSLLDSLSSIHKSDHVVLELSSYMLEHVGQARWSPHVAVITLIGSDHLDWHRSREAYVNAKKNILRFQRNSDYAVINRDDVGAASFATDALGLIVRYGLLACRRFELRIPGEHNQLNAQGAFAAAQIAGVTWEEAQSALTDFPGLPHRLQLVHESNGVFWYNDSIATIPAAAVAALESFPPGRVIQIIGGKDKHLPIDAMCRSLLERAKALLCIGDTGAMLAGKLEQLRLTGAPAIHHCVELPIAAALARRIAQPGDIVLLSPGYPSFDQFVNFEARGNAFGELARG
jgi:UDP-N-acetylmuramoylalanine--D-glutamate ligase